MEKTGQCCLQIWINLWIISILGIAGVQGQQDFTKLVYPVIGSVCGFVFIALILLVVCICCRKPRKRKNDSRDLLAEQGKTSSLPKQKFSNRQSPPIAVVQPQASNQTSAYPGVKKPNHLLYPPSNSSKSHHDHDPRIFTSEPNLYIASKSSGPASGGLVRTATLPKTEEKSKSTTLPPETIKDPKGYLVTNKEDGVVRAYNDLSVRTKASMESRYVAKAFSHYDHDPLAQLDEEGRHVARANNFSAMEDPSGTQKTDSGYGGSNARLTSLSDWSLGGAKRTHSVERTRSFADKGSDVSRKKPKAVQRASSFQVPDVRKDSHIHNYRPAIIKEVDVHSRSNSDVHNSHLSQERNSSKGKKKSDKKKKRHSGPEKSHPNQKYLALQNPKQGSGKALRRSKSDASAIKHYNAPNDPHAIYARPDKLKRQSAEVKGRHSPPPPPVPPPLGPLGVINHGFDGSDEESTPQRMTVEAVVERPPDEPRDRKIRSMDELRSVASSDPETSYSVKGKKLTHDAFKFLEEFDDSFADDLGDGRR